MGRWNNDSQVSKTFDKELDQFAKGELAENHVFDLGRMPGYLIDLGFKDSRFTHMSGEDLRHGIPEAVLPEMKGFAEHWKDPVAVFSGQTADDMRVILDIGSREKPHYLAVATDRNYNSYPVTAIHDVTSSPELKIMKLVEQDRALWLDKERMMAIYTRQHLRGHQNGNINMNYAKTVIEHFRNPGEDRVVFDIDDYLEQVGGRSLPYTGEPAKRLVEESLKNVVDDGRSVRYPVNIGTTGYFKDKNSDGKTIWTAFDNTAGDCYVEDFTTKEAARAYALKFEEADYAREVDVQQAKHETEYAHPESKEEEDHGIFLDTIVLNEDSLDIKDVGDVKFDEYGELEVEMAFSDGYAEELPALDNLSSYDDRYHFAMTYPTVAEVENDPNMQDEITRYTGRNWDESTFLGKVYDIALKFGAVSIDRHVKIAAEQDGNTVVWTGHDATEARELFDKGETIAVMTSDRNPVNSLTSEIYYAKGESLFFDSGHRAEYYDDIVTDFSEWLECDGYGHMPDIEKAKSNDFSYWTKTVYPVTRTVPQQQAVNPEMQVFIKNLVTATVAPGEHKQLPVQMYLSNKDLPQRAWTHFGIEHNTVVLYADARKSYPSVSILSSMLTEKEKSSVYNVIKTVCQASKQQEGKGISLARTVETENVTDDMETSLRNSIQDVIKRDEHVKLPVEISLADKELSPVWTHYGIVFNTVVLYSDEKRRAPCVSIMSDKLTEQERKYVFDIIKKANKDMVINKFFDMALPLEGHEIKYDKPVSIHYKDDSGLHDMCVLKVERINEFLVFEDKNKGFTFDFLTSTSKDKLFKESMAQCARDAIFARVTGPSNHFIDEERRFLDAATKGWPENAKSAYFNGLLKDLEPRFKADSTPDAWIDDVREELDDLAKGKVRDDIIQRGI